MRDNATVIYLIHESNIIYCWWSFMRFASLFASNFGIPVAHWRNEKRKIAVAMATMVVVFRGSMTLTRLGRLRRKMKRYDKGVRDEKERSTRCEWRMQSAACQVNVCVYVMLDRIANVEKILTVFLLFLYISFKQIYTTYTRFWNITCSLS